MTHTAINTDSLLVQWSWTEPSDTAGQIFADSVYSQAFNTALQQVTGLQQALHIERFVWSQATGRAYLYLRLAARTFIAPSVLQGLRAATAPWLPAATNITASRLELVFEKAGASAGAKRQAHYVVEMDPDDGWMPEIARWYDEEHMPGLASVEGCIHAWRYLNHDSGPLSLACYDLTAAEVLGCPAWLKVRATAWSDITRPHFTNTIRTMFTLPFEEVVAA